MIMAMITVIIRIVTMVTIVVKSNNDTYTIILNRITYIYIYQNNIYKSVMPNSLMSVIIAAIVCW